LLIVEGETCTIQLTSRPTAFQSTVVKPYLQLEPEPITDSLTNETITTKITTNSDSQQQLLKRGRGRLRKYPLLIAMTDVTIYLQNNPITVQFSLSRQKEITGLLEKGVFEVTKLADMPKGIRLFNSRFVDEIKNPGTDKAFEKSRLVVQAYNDQEKELVLTQSLTIQRVSQRLILCIATMKLNDNTGLYLRDISQAYV